MDLGGEAMFFTRAPDGATRVLLHMDGTGWFLKTTYIPFTFGICMSVATCSTTHSGFVALILSTCSLAWCEHASCSAYSNPPLSPPSREC